MFNFQALTSSCFLGCRSDKVGFSGIYYETVGHKSDFMLLLVFLTINVFYLNYVALLVLT